MKNRESEQSFLNLFFDLLILNTTIPVTIWMLTGESSLDIHRISQYLILGNLSWIFTDMIFGGHNIYMTENFFIRFLRISREVIIFGVLSFVITTVLLPEIFSKQLLGACFLVFYAVKLSFYLLLYKYLFFKRKKELNTKRVLIVGMNDTGRLIRRFLECNPILGCKFVGFVHRGSETQKDTLGSVDNLEKLIQENNIQKVFVTTSLFSNGELLREYLEICNRHGICLRFVCKNQPHYHFRNLSMESEVENMVMINPQELPLDRLNNRILKRLFDIVFSMFVVAGICSWLIPIMAILIKVSSRGPVFFKQKRTGLNNKTFDCYKFRSMKCNAVADIKQATAGDERITPLGRFMRRYYIDEIPQFLNVLWGDMSVVGPRPHILKHTEIYEKLIRDYQVRHFYKPGVTGWAQVSGYCGETEQLWKMQKRIEYDIEYNENWTFGLDLKIIWLTVFGTKQALRVVSNSQTKAEDIHQEVNRRLYEPITHLIKRAVL